LHERPAKTKKQLMEELERERESSGALQKAISRLAITRPFCEMMGSTVLVESEPGKGSTFTMNLPAVVEESLGT
tara:strand:- start:117 stop:338 length:222 start_codon:yes stop_codon:yes gene_type:complete